MNGKSVADNEKMRLLLTCRREDAAMVGMELNGLQLQTWIRTTFYGFMTKRFYRDNSRRLYLGGII